MSEDAKNAGWWATCAIGAECEALDMLEAGDVRDGRLLDVYEESRLLWVRSVEDLLRALGYEDEAYRRMREAGLVRP